MCEDWHEFWSEMNGMNKDEHRPLFAALANNIIKEVKGYSCNVLAQKLNWVDFKNYRHMAKQQKEEIEAKLRAAVFK